MNKSIFLSQSYEDVWNDYQRSIKSNTFPVWDYIILTASNSHQAESFEKQIRSRQNYLPKRTKFKVIPDEGGVRVGSGGATLSVLKWIREQEDSFKGLRILVIHSGGDSKRVPQYSVLGKIFSAVPHCLPDGRSSTLFDEVLISMASVPGRIHEGMVLLSGDVLLLFNPLLIDYSGHGAAAISFKEEVEVGKNHGVFLKGSDGKVKAFLHKQTVETLEGMGAVNERGKVDIDTGGIIFGTDILDGLYSLISTEDNFSQEKYDSLVNSRVRLSLYGDFLYPLATDSTLEDFYFEKPEGEFNDELKEARTLVWKALHIYSMKLLCLAPSKFIHFGTTREILNLMNEGISEYNALGWHNQINSSVGSLAGYNSVIASKAKVGKGCYLEASYVHGEAIVGEGTVLSYIDIHNEVIPPNCVLHGVKQLNGKFICRIYGTMDNPKENRLFGKELRGNLWSDGEEYSLWNANIYPECDTIEQAISEALKLYEEVNSGRELKANGKSLADGFNDADSTALLDWNRRMTELVEMNKIAELIEKNSSVKEARLNHPLTKIQLEWLEKRMKKLSEIEKMRLYYYVGYALDDENMISSAFYFLSDTILEYVLDGLKVNLEAEIKYDSYEVNLPLRINWAGGWSDTPPYCNENGGIVLNAAILLNGERPVKVRLKKLKEKKIIFESRDMDVYGEFTEIGELQAVGNPFDPFVLQKAALLACGIIPKKGGNLAVLLDRLKGGFLMETEVTGVPKGSGLGTSSILSAACVKALFHFFGIDYTDSDIYAQVLCMEQIMSTGGGWQDQVGGVTDGIKYISTKPGMIQDIKVQPLVLEEEIINQLNDRFVLIYTGLRRLARNLLRDVVGNYIGNNKNAVNALNEIQKIAVLMRMELERGNINEFARLLSMHWELSKVIDKGCTNTLIEQILETISDLIEGKMICGAGGGGFLQVILKEGVKKEELQDRLKFVFDDSDINVWDCRIL
ncbi:MAG: fucose pyrophosphorylase domain-containing protein [Catonella sp.]|uniref:fucose pyrophosphorylase domain-containing protein n=1 Tax=Catonella sp. TaxID=2382125 RepID=UPI003F9ECFA9